jgi:hypothetical protein
MVIGILLALIVAVLVGMDAKKRGMDPMGWGIFVFLLLIIGLPVYLINRKPLPVKTVQVQEQRQTSRNSIPDHPVFARENYMWMLAGVVVIAIGMFLMAGGKSSDPTVFNKDEVYSTTRITIAPLLIMLGLVIEIFAVFRKPKAVAV